MFESGGDFYFSNDKSIVQAKVVEIKFDPNYTGNMYLTTTNSSGVPNKSWNFLGGGNNYSDYTGVELAAGHWRFENKTTNNNWLKWINNVHYKWENKINLQYRILE